MLQILKIASAAVALAIPLGQGSHDTGLVTPAASSTIQFEVCNKTNDEAVVAVHYIPVGGSHWYNEGWFTIPAQQCKNVIETDNSYLYARGEVSGDPDQFWAGDETHCVIYPGPFSFYESTGEYCDGGQETVEFQEIHFTGVHGGVFTWSLTD